MWDVLWHQHFGIYSKSHLDVRYFLLILERSRQRSMWICWCVMSVSFTPSGLSACLLALLVWVLMWRNWLTTVLQSDHSWSTCRGYCFRWEGRKRSTQTLIVTVRCVPGTTAGGIRMWQCAEFPNFCYFALICLIVFAVYLPQTDITLSQQAKFAQTVCFFFEFLTFSSCLCCL